ncbi:hypothetical protein MTO96_036925 [Rhipicephalus appendiculatus]
MHEQVTRASDVLEALNISVGALLSIQTQLQLFRFVGQTSLRTGLPLVVSVRLRGDQLGLGRRAQPRPRSATRQRQGVPERDVEGPEIGR